MKRNIKRAGAALVACATIASLGSPVYASNLTAGGALNISNALGDHLTVTNLNYDAENNLNEVTITLLADQTNLNAILAQKSGHTAKLSDFYFGIVPEAMKNAPLATLHKDGVWTRIDAGKTNAQIVADAKAAVDADTGPNTSTTFWPLVAFVQYYDGATWVKSATESDGVKTIADDLVVQLGLNNASELEYGVNYRIGMYTDWYYTLGWNDTANPGVYEYVKMNFEIKFPVTGNKDDGTAIYYISLEKAIEDGAEDIVINTDTTVTDNVTIPAGVTVTVADGATLTVAEDKTLTVEEGAELNGDTEGYVVIVEPEEETPDNEDSPDTGDNIEVVLAMAGVSLIGLLGSVIIAKKQ